ncbi:MAG: DUF1295 domain-containing protein [Acidobacteriota bacterium]|nr:DUF1295 domain-containing protein [Acidobacteriota bacterium]MDE3222929.1 DUF1295 domain-containing protein [Acidobacteriota bacterium]
MSVLTLVIILAAAAIGGLWIASLVTRDYSWVDRAWSILPVLYVGAFAVAARLRDVRLDLMAILVTAWGVRLTYNFARKGGYRGVEDYRWGVLRERMSARQFQLFNFFFIAFYQNVLLLLISLPALDVYQHRQRALTPADAMLAALFVLCLVLETVADNQQWRFQQEKYRQIELGRAPTVRFCQSGLFRYSRHPNYFFEIAQWWVVYLFGAIASDSFFHLTLSGPVLLTLLFVGSTRFTEEISLSRYPEYATYQASTSAVVPWIRRAASDRPVITAERVND